MLKVTDIAHLESTLGYTFSDPTLLRLALTHCSSQLPDGEDHNEKLEFLGDAVLGLAVSALLFRHYPQYREGDLSKMRASLVNAQVLALRAESLALGSWLRMGWGEERSGGRQKSSILAAAYEAVLGAVYLDGGYTAAAQLIARHFEEDLRQTGRIDEYDSKTRLQELTQKIFKETPAYEDVEVHGPDHQKRFVSQVSIAGKIYGSGEGRNKKSAHQAAAFQTLEILKQEDLATAEEA